MLKGKESLTMCRILTWTDHEAEVKTTDEPEK
jgi:hypothetical protein